MQEELYVVGSAPDVYLEMMGDADEIDTFVRVPPANEAERFLRVRGLPEGDTAWVH